MPKEQEVCEVLRRLRHEGWDEEPGRGSHVVFRKEGRLVVVLTAKREILIGTYRNIAKAAGWSDKGRKQA